MTERQIGLISCALITGCHRFRNTMAAGSVHQCAEDSRSRLTLSKIIKEGIQASHTTSVESTCYPPKSTSFVLLAQTAEVWMTRRCRSTLDNLNRCLHITDQQSWNLNYCGIGQPQILSDNFETKKKWNVHGISCGTWIRSHVNQWINAVL